MMSMFPGYLPCLSIVSAQLTLDFQIIYLTNLVHHLHKFNQLMRSFSYAPILLKPYEILRFV